MRVIKPKSTIYVLLIFILLAVGTTLYSNRDSDDYLHQPSPELPKPPLKELAENKGIQLGNFASLKYLRERPYSELLENEFEHLVIDGEPNWSFEDHELRPGRHKFDFSDMDHVFDFADERDMPVRVQHLLWGDEKWLPEWLKTGDFSDNEILDIIKEHIQTVAARYKGKVREYTVVNEAFSRKLGKGGNQDWWGQRLDTKYIDQAFIWARDSDPDAILILNDFGNEYDSDVARTMHDYAADAVKRGIPIDAIGMQMHIDGSSAKSKEEVVKTMRRFSEIGLKVYVTEFDVNMHNVHESPEKENEIQAQIYADMMGACIEVGPEICPSFSFLGLVDRQSWYGGIGLEDANPLMFNDDYSPKPAFFSLRNQLQQ